MASALAKIRSSDAQTGYLSGNFRYYTVNDAAHVNLFKGQFGQVHPLLRSNVELWAGRGALRPWRSLSCAVIKGKVCAWRSSNGVQRGESHLRCPSKASSRRRQMACEFDGMLTAFVGDTTMALVEDGEVLGSRQLDIGNSALDLR